jgi:hypothetical protein
VIALRTRWTSSLAVAMAAAATLAALRGLPFIVWPHSAFDSDQAIVGLMAKHLSEGRALPLFFYGQPYMLAVQAWIAAPLFLVGGASIALLKLPLVIVNAIAAALLVWTLVRHAELPPASAFLASAFFAMCPPVAGAQLVAAMGGSVEPFLYVLLIWVLRERPIVCGVVAGIGFLHREFTAYGLAALFITDVVYRARDWRRLAPRWLIVSALFLAVVEAGGIVRPFGDMFGPDIPKLQGVSAISNLEAIAVRVECPSGLEIGENVRWLVRRNLPTLAGTSGTATNEFFAGPAMAPSPIVWVLLSTVLVVAALRAAGLAWFSRTPIPAVLVFLLLLGVQAIVVYVSRCGVRDPTLIRYTLFTLLIPVAVFGAYLRVEPVRALRWVMLALLTLWLLWSARSYLLIVTDYVSSPPISRHAVMAAELERRNIRYGYASYWDAHHINFLTNERVILAPLPPSRIYSYDAIVWHAPEKFYVQSTPCPGELIGSLWLCPA